mgnify:CR=1 FL=1
MNCNPHIIESEIGQNLYRALVAKYTAEIVQARSTLMIYFTNPVGIGEHPQHLEEMECQNLRKIISMVFSHLLL